MFSIRIPSEKLESENKQILTYLTTIMVNQGLSNHITDSARPSIQ